MKIRSITTFINPGYPLQEATLEQAGAFIASARPAFTSAGFEVQTTRLATNPFPQLLGKVEQTAALELALALEEKAQANGFDYVSIGPALPTQLESYLVIPSILGKTRNVFCTGMLDIGGRQISLAAVRACAQVIQEASTLSADGFTNLRFAALANVPPGTPFFPAAYHDGGQPGFSLACEAADLAVDVFGATNSLEQASQGLIERVEWYASKLVEVSQHLAASFEVVFYGLDFTLAPYPETHRSIVTALESLGLPGFGWHGSLAASAFLASTLDAAHYPRAGFNGVFLPVLEDSTLASRACEGCLTLNELLLYSAVCGTGLDTIPLPGDVTVEQLSAVLLDLAALAVRLDKPLTARLMPIPGKQAGEPTGFDFAYFANSSVMSIQAKPLSRFLAKDGYLTLSHLAERGKFV